MKKLIFIYGLLTILLGVGVLASVIHFEEVYHPAHSSMGGLVLKFAEHLGIAFLSIGAIGLLLEIPHLHGQFHKQLVDTLVDDKYLEKFKKEELEEHQKKVLRLFFKIKDIDRPGSFFEFHREKIQQYIGKPYREGTHAITKLRYSDDTKKFFIVEETISYYCRKLGESIQDEVKWIAEKDEMQEIRDFHFRVTVPEKDYKSPTFAAEYPNVPGREAVYDAASPLLKKYERGHGFTLPLDAYMNKRKKGIDGLYVETHVTYVVPVGRAFPWTMPVPSKALSGEITFPPELKIYIDLFGMDDDPKLLKSSKDTPGSYTYSYLTWLLPGDGFEYHFQEAEG